jgi:hypothetical protein
VAAFLNLSPVFSVIRLLGSGPHFFSAKRDVVKLKPKTIKRGKKIPQKGIYG